MAQTDALTAPREEAGLSPRYRLEQEIWTRPKMGNLTIAAALLMVIWIIA